MQLRDLLKSVSMTVARVTPQTGMREAAAEMIQRDLTAILVIDEHGLRGVLTCGAVIRWLLNAAMQHERVGQVMCCGPPTASPDRSLPDAIADMTAAKSDFIVMCEAGRVIGLILLKDLLHEQGRLLYAEIEHLQDYIERLHAASED